MTQASEKIEHRIWNPRYEQMSEDERAQLQLERLQATLQRVYRNVRFYRKRFEEIGFEPEDLKDFSDLSKLPFTVPV